MDTKTPAVRGDPGAHLRTPNKPPFEDGTESLRSAPRSADTMKPYGPPSLPDSKARPAVLQSQKSWRLFRKAAALTVAALMSSALHATAGQKLMEDRSGFLSASSAPAKLATTSPYHSCDLDKCTKNDKGASLTGNGATLFGRACFSQDHICTAEVQIENFSTMTACITGMRKWFSGAGYIIQETLAMTRNVEDNNVSLRCGPTEALKRVEKDASLGVDLDRT